MNALRLEINIGTEKQPRWEDVFLPDDASIEFEMNSLLWNDASNYSYGFTIPIAENRHIMGNADQMHGQSVFDALYDKPYRLWVEGTIFSVGHIKMDEEVEVENGEVEIELTSGRKTLDDILDNVKCRDIDLERENIVVGYVNNVANGAINDPTDERSKQGLIVDIKVYERTSYVYVSKGVSKLANYDGGDKDDGHKWKLRSTISGLNLGFFNALQQLIITPDYDLYKEYIDRNGDPEEDMPSKLNISYGYDAGAKFCHIPMCSQKYTQEGDNWNRQRDYSENPDGSDPGRADRPDSAPCFYVLYVIDLLFKQLGIPLQNDIKNIGDANRLAFLHLDRHIKVGAPVEKSGDFLGWTYIYQNTESAVDKSVFEYYYRKDDSMNKHNKHRFLEISDTVDGVSIDPNEELTVVKNVGYEGNMVEWHKEDGKRKKFTIYKTKRVKTVIDKSTFGIKDPYVHYALATSDNLPDEDVSTVIEALEHMFGAKFMYDDVHGTCKVVLLRDVLSQVESQTIVVNDYEVHKKENHVRGFRLKYGASSTYTPNELEKRLGKGESIVTGSADTTYNYNDWDKVLLLNGSKNPFRTYGYLINNIGQFDENCYVDVKNGNAYRIKVNSDANTANSKSNDSDKTKLDPSLFQVGGYADVEIGDCTDSDFVEEVSIGFTPLIPNDTNVDEEKTYYKTPSASDFDVPLPNYVMFSDEELHNGESSEARYEYSIDDVCEQLWQSSDVIPVMTLLQYYNKMPLGWDMSKGFDSPLQQGSYGLTIGILRAGNEEGSIFSHDADYDNRGNSQWSFMGSSEGQVTSDSVDSYGNVYSNYERHLLIDGNQKYTKQELYDIVAQHYPLSNADLKNTEHFNSEVDLESGELGVFYDYSTTIFEAHGQFVLATTVPRSKNNTTWAGLTGDYASKVEQYFDNLRSRSTSIENMFNIDGYPHGLAYKGGLCMLIGHYPTEAIAKHYEEFINQLGSVLNLFTNHPNETFSIDANLYEYTVTTGLSLKLKAEKKNPYHNASKEHPVQKLDFDPYKADCDEQGYWKISNPAARRRGIYDRFYEQYAYWVINRKIAVFSIPRGAISLAALINIDHTKRYKIGDITGFINKISVNIDQDGLGDVTIEMYYL